jgi:hypothetical protein
VPSVHDQSKPRRQNSSDPDIHLKSLEDSFLLFHSI